MVARKVISAAITESDFDSIFLTNENCRFVTTKRWVCGFAFQLRFRDGSDGLQLRTLLDFGINVASGGCDKN